MEFLEKVEQRGKWPQQACTTMYFLIPNNVTSERPIALMPTLIRWEVANWQQKYRVDRVATDGRNGAQRTVWEVLMEMERLKQKNKEPWPWSWGIRLNGSVSVWCGPGRRSSASQGRSCGCCAATSSTRGECSSKVVWRSRSGPSRPSCQGRSRVACFCVLCCRMR